jgi:hypothetical protein
MLRALVSLFWLLPMVERNLYYYGVDTPYYKAEAWCLLKSFVLHLAESLVAWLTEPKDRPHYHLA